ncbi:hypothetical protein [Allopusillimonas soli]|uniref:Uncharacterized protein n=1 Tax=Allopusillimonas soli TaxID=659016 RepID=A0A853F9K1_9BURK|nr:hypothetical protein [Allopusillimonas soli]NYT36647.1 hypothetical protein [Allopusillimonas soli]
MASQSTAKKQPFVIEPLNWVAPDTARKEAEQREEAKQAAKQEKRQD